MKNSPHLSKRRSCQQVYMRTLWIFTFQFEQSGLRKNIDCKFSDKMKKMLNFQSYNGIFGRKSFFNLLTFFFFESNSTSLVFSGCSKPKIIVANIWQKFYSPTLCFQFSVFQRPTEVLAEFHLNIEIYDSYRTCCFWSLWISTYNFPIVKRIGFNWELYQFWTLTKKVVTWYTGTFSRISSLLGGFQTSLYKRFVV